MEFVFHSYYHLLPELSLFQQTLTGCPISQPPPFLKLAGGRANVSFICLKLRDSLAINFTCRKRNPAQLEQEFAVMNPKLAQFS